MASSISTVHKWVEKADIDKNLLQAIKILSIHMNEYPPMEKCELLAHIQQKMKKMQTHHDEDLDSDTARLSPQYRLIHLNDNNERMRSNYYAFISGIYDSENINAIFCTVCILFGTKKCAFRSNGIEISAKNYVEANQVLTRHEKSKGHLEAYNLYMEFSERKRSIGVCFLYVLCTLHPLFYLDFTII